MGARKSVILQGQTGQNFRQAMRQLFWHNPDVVTKPPKTLPSLLQQEVAGRLRALRDELGMTEEEIAKRVGATRESWSNWVGRTAKANPPPVAKMIRLCGSENEHLTLDWIYRGVGDMVPHSRLVRLTARLLGMDPDEATQDILKTPIRDLKAVAATAGQEQAKEATASEPPARQVSASAKQKKKTPTPSLK